MTPPPLLETTPPADRQDIIRDGIFWFQDGNIILVAKDHGPDARPTGFRVHKGVLSRHSVTFDALLSFPPPQPTDPDLVEGCPVMHVTDCTHDTRDLVRVSYDGWLWDRHVPMKFCTAAALVRLSHKYEICWLFEAAIKRLNAVFTDNRRVWNLNIGQSNSSLSLKSEDAIEAVNLFRTTQMPRMLPVALYLCSELESAILLRGVIRHDGFLEQLSADDLRRCLDGKESLMSAKTSYALSTIGGGAPFGCYTPLECDRVVRAARPAYAFVASDDNHPPLRIQCTVSRGALMPIFNWSLLYGLCPMCRAILLNRDDDFSRRLWRRLPEIMRLDIEGWDSASG
ncbi:hypothetical protein BV20DRAFT_1057524 [Pilatotrama ljubarskyi]|nr:hypothetical protein BV20DRAFT_1057524 [Pilatotrama ljubarskyi]